MASETTTQQGRELRPQELARERDRDVHVLALGRVVDAGGRIQRKPGVPVARVGEPPAADHELAALQQDLGSDA